MDSSDERIVAAMCIELFFAANVIIAIVLPTLLGGYLNTLGYTTGIWFGIDWFEVCPKLYSLWSNLLFLLPLYAIIQAAPEGAFNFIILKFGDWWY